MGCLGADTARRRRLPPVATAPPTPTPVPPATATPVAQLSFWADRTNINQGECVTLNWSVENVQAVWVYPRGENFERFPRTGQGSEQVCPRGTTTYEMRVLQRDGSTVFREVTINVAGPTPTNTPAATATPVPPTATPAPPAATNPLAGTRWEVVQYNNGRGAVTSLIADTRISMDFSADGQLTGSASCNNYFTSYQVNDNAITIGPAGSASAACAEPEGIMQQETDFLAILPASATFRIDGNTLEIRTGSDEIGVIAQRAP